jgi:hypothetical protein
MMPYLALLLCLCCASAMSAQAVFNPDTMPVAIESDSVLLLTVSPYTLARSLQKGQPGCGSVKKVEITRKKGENYLTFTTHLPQVQLINIRLQRSPNQPLWYAIGGAITCGTDCADCDGNCKCGDKDQDCPRFQASNGKIPLAKINLSALE